MGIKKKGSPESEKESLANNRSQNSEGVHLKRKWDDQACGSLGGTTTIPARDEHQGFSKWASEFRTEAQHHLQRGNY